MNMTIIRIISIFFAVLALAIILFKIQSILS
jgi:hypothetical protein